MLADPQHLVSAGALIRENRASLEYLSELIAWRVKTCGEREPNEWNSDNPFFWRYALQGKEVPPDVEEHVASLWERRDLVHAEAAFQLLIDAFPEYADGYNYLGLIALERQDLARAEDFFRKTIDVGRRLLPKRVARSSWWRDDKTRPYMRGLRNLATALLRAARYGEAKEIANRLEVECSDDLSASSYCAAIGLNTGDWKLAAESASRLRGIWPEEGLIDALAHVEMGKHPTALQAFVHAALNKPRAVRIVLGIPSKAPKTSIETEDHNTGVHFREVLGGYLGGKSRGVPFLRRAANDPRVSRLLLRVEELQGKWFGHPRADRSIFDELTRMQRPDFAAEHARLFGDLAGGGTANRTGRTAILETSRRRARAGISRAHLH
jgi:tetratricopeptide (TPR) repeat protein